MQTALETSQTALRVLLVDDDPDMHAIVNGLWEGDPHLFQLDWVSNLEEGVSHLSKYRPDVVLLDLHLPESKGLDTFRRFKGNVPFVPIVVMTSLDDERCALQALREGAQDYLVKGHVNGLRLVQVLRYAIERHQLQRPSKESNLLDEITGLYNRKGFLTMVEQQLKSAQRTHTGLLVFLSVLNDLDKITAQFGTTEGHHALDTAARILKENFRSSDVIARMGADRFVIAPSGYKPYAIRLIHSRLEKSQTYYNVQFNRYKLSLSLCSMRFDPNEIRSPSHLALQLDALFDRYVLERQNASSDGFLTANGSTNAPLS